MGSAKSALSPKIVIFIAGMIFILRPHMLHDGNDPISLVFAYNYCGTHFQIGHCCVLSNPLF